MNLAQSSEFVASRPSHVRLSVVPCLSSTGASPPQPYANVRLVCSFCGPLTLSPMFPDTHRERSPRMLPAASLDRPAVAFRGFDRLCSV